MTLTSLTLHLCFFPYKLHFHKNELTSNEFQDLWILVRYYIHLKPYFCNSYLSYFILFYLREKFSLHFYSSFLSFFTKVILWT